MIAKSFQFWGLDVLGISWVSGHLWPPALALACVKEKKRVRPLVIALLLICLLSMERFDDLGSPKPISWNCMFGGIFSHMAFPVDLGCPGAIFMLFRWRGTNALICPLYLRSTWLWCWGCRDLLCRASGAEREALRKHPAKGQASLSGNFHGCKS